MIKIKKFYPILLIGAFITTSPSIIAQDDVKRETYEPSRDTTISDSDRNRDDEWNEHRGIRWHSRDGDWDVNFRLGTMFAIGLSTYIYDGGFNLPGELDYLEQELGKSTHVKWDFIRHRVGKSRKPVSFEYGLAFSYMNYAFTNSTRLVTGQQELTYVIDPVTYKKNKFKTTFLEVPLMLSILSNPEYDRRGFNLSVGGYAGILLKSKQKFKGPDGKEKVKDDFNLNKFRYGFQGMIGVGHVNLYMQYSMVDLFKDNEGPELTPFNVGIVLAGF